MADPHTIIEVYTIPPDTKKPYLERYRTINALILGLTYPHSLPPKSRSRLELLEPKAAEDHLIYDLPEGIQNGPHEGVYKGRSNLISTSCPMLDTFGTLWVGEVGESAPLSPSKDTIFSICVTTEHCWTRTSTRDTRYVAQCFY